MTLNIDRGFLYENYVSEQRSLGDIAAIIGCSRTCISKALKRFGIQARTKTAARQLALARGKIAAHGKVYRKITANLNFFDLWTPEMAWVLGLLFTDGNMMPGYRRGAKTTCSADRISLSQKDPELLRQVLVAMESNATIMRNGRGMHSIALHGYYDQLLRLGMTPRKSLTIEFPASMPDPMRRHFVRGCWDGDGSFYLEYGHVPKASFGTGSKQMIKDMALVFDRQGILYNGPYHTKALNPYYTIRVVRKDDLAILARFLYAQVDESICLKRKRDMLLSFT